MTTTAVTSQISFAGTAEGTLGPFSLIKSTVPIYFADSAEIVVLRYDTVTDLVPELLVENVDYSIAGGPSSGTVTLLTPAQTALTTNERLFVYRSTPLDQETAFTTGGNFSASSIEDAYDHIVRQVQDLQRQINNSVRIVNFELDELPTDGLTVDIALDKIPYLTGTAANPSWSTIDASTLTTDVALVAANIADVETVAADLSGADTIGVVAGDLVGADNIGTVAENIDSIITVAQGGGGGGGTTYLGGAGINISGAVISVDIAELDSV